MPLLSTPLVIHGADLERISRKALNDSGGLNLNRHDYEDALSFLVAEAWELGQRWNPRHPRASRSFGDHGIYLLRLRYTSWLRQHLGDNRHSQANGQPPTPNRQILFGDEHDLDPRDRHHLTDVRTDGDGSDGGATAIERLDREGISNRARYLRAIHAEMCRRSTTRHQGKEAA